MIAQRKPYRDSTADLSERMERALALACEVGAVQTWSSVARALERRGLVVITENSWGKPSIAPTRLGREIAAQLRDDAGAEHGIGLEARA